MRHGGRRRWLKRWEGGTKRQVKREGAMVGFVGNRETASACEGEREKGGEGRQVKKRAKKGKVANRRAWGQGLAKGRKRSRE